MAESREQRYVRKDLMPELRKRLPGCFIIKNDPDYVQGIPDLLILWKDKWAMLEAKESHEAPNRPNQPYYVELFGNMSFASFIYPENERMVLDALQHAFGVEGPARLFEPE